MSRPRRTLVLGDVHFPFQHKGAVDWAVGIAKQMKPEVIVQVADLYDLFSFSRYPRSSNAITPDVEMDKARSGAENFWNRLQEASPGTTCYQLWGNHEDRAHKRALEALSSAERWVMQGMREMMTFKGVCTVPSSRDVLVIDRVRYLHGWMTQRGAHLSEIGENCVFGHTHKAWVYYRGSKWELNTGCLIDLRAPAFSYYTLRKSPHVQVGVGMVDSFGPRFIPYLGQDKYLGQEK